MCHTCVKMPHSTIPRSSSPPWAKTKMIRSSSTRALALSQKCIAAWVSNLSSELQRIWFKPLMSSTTSRTTEKASNNSEPSWKNKFWLYNHFWSRTTLILVQFQIKSSNDLLRKTERIFSASRVTSSNTRTSLQPRSSKRVTCGQS